MRNQGFRAFLLVVPEKLKHPENPEGIFQVFREPFFAKRFPGFPTVDFSGKWRGALSRIVSRRGGPPARPPARCTVATASRWRVRRCLTCRGAPPPPRGAGCPENTSLGTIARNPRLGFREISCPENPAPSSARNSGQWCPSLIRFLWI